MTGGAANRFLKVTFTLSSEKVEKVTTHVSMTEEVEYEFKIENGGEGDPTDPGKDPENPGSKDPENPGSKDPEKDPDKDGLGVGAIIAIVLGSLVLLLLILYVAFFFVWKKQEAMPDALKFLAFLSPSYQAINKLFKKENK